MKTYKVKNTIDNSVEFFNSLKDAKEHVESEIKWYSSENELKNGTGYDENDFQIFESITKFVIKDCTSNTCKDYIDSDGNNSIEENAILFDSEQDAHCFEETLPNYKNWAAVIEIEIFE